MKSLLLLALCALFKYAGAACYSGSDPILCSDDSCKGSCTIDNGCLCAHGLINCVPSTSQCPMKDNSCCNNLVGWYWDRNLQCCTDNPLCNPSCLSDEFCDVINKAAVCVCNSTAYKGIKTSDVRPIVNCDSGLMTVSVSRCQLQQLGYDYGSFHLTNDSVLCTFTYEESINNIRVQSIQLKAAIEWCGNLVTKTDSLIHFYNTLYISPKSGPLITKNPIAFNVTCEYNLTMQTGLIFSPQP